MMQKLGVLYAHLVFSEVFRFPLAEKVLLGIGESDRAGELGGVSTNDKSAFNNLSDSFGGV